MGFPRTEPAASGLRERGAREGASPGAPRLRQRQRTRAALVEAARQAVARGLTPTIESAAEAAGVSRATAYRYFTSQPALVLEATLDAIAALPDVRALDTGTVEARVDAAVHALLRIAYDHEAVLRTFLKLSLEQWLRDRKAGVTDYPVRKGRRTAWLERALAPATTLSARQKRRLRIALSMLCGAEAMVVGEDVCRSTPAETESVCRWAAGAILRAALDEAAKPKTK